MGKEKVTLDERDALRIILTEVSAELATIVAMHEEGCYLRGALEICLKLAGMDRAELLEVWNERVADGR